MQSDQSIKKLALALLLILGSSRAAMAQASATSPVYQTRPGENHISLYEKSTSIIQHNARIKSVLDFDADVVRIQPIQGHPDQIDVYALATGVTTVTLIDENEQFTKVELLVRGDVRHLESYLKRLYPDDALHVEEIKGTVLLSGWVTRPESINQIVSIAEQFYPQVLNHMRIGGVQQVQLKATVMEVNRSKMRQLGMNFGLIGNRYWVNSTPGPITPITAVTPQVGNTNITFTGFANTSASFGFISPSANFQSFLTALKTEGLLKIHATPMIVTHNGQPAELLNGGETPVLVPAGLGTTAIEFKPFGIILNAVPHILGNGRLRLQVEPSVVERDFASAITVDGITVPSFTVRKVNTQVEMNFGETLVIGGLVNKREDGSTAKIPVLGELPWIGAAFGQKTYTEAETELVILVTPTYVAPLSPEEVPPGGIGKFTTTPVDRELLGLGLLEVPRVGDDCDATFNCMECDPAGGQCSRCRTRESCLNGLLGRGGSRGDNGACSDEGCVEGAFPAQPGLIGPGGPEPAPGIIAPGSSLSTPPLDPDVPVIRSGQSSGGGGSARQVSASGDAIRESDGPKKKPGFLAPLFR